MLKPWAYKINSEETSIYLKEIIMEIEGYDLKELTFSEKAKINGGFFGIDDLIIGVLVAAAAAVINDWDNFKNGIAGKPEVN